MNNFNLTLRAEALEWWRDLSEDNQISILENAGYMYRRRWPQSLTGREIQELYQKFN